MTPEKANEILLSTTKQTNKELLDAVMKENQRMTELVEKLKQAKILRKAMNATVIVRAKDAKSESPQPNKQASIDS